jgi:hypothetical protein
VLDCCQGIRMDTQQLCLFPVLLVVVWLRPN